MAGDGYGALHETGADSTCLRRFLVGCLLGGWPRCVEGSGLRGIEFGGFDAAI